MMLTRKHWIGLAVGAAVVLGMSSTVYAAEPLTFICNPFPPQKIESKDSEYPGFDVEILKEALARQGIKASFAFAPWARAYKLATQEDAAGLCSCSFREERTNDFLFSNELGEVAVGFFYRQGSPKAYRTLEDLRGANVGVIRGYNLSAELKEKGVEHIEVNSEYNLARMLAAERIDVAFSYRDTFLYYVKQEGISEPFSYAPLRKSPYFVCINRAHPNAEALRDAVNLGLDKLRSEGGYQDIINKYTAPIQ